MIQESEIILRTFEDLKSKFYNEFPKSCSSCERVYETLDDFINRTRPIAQGSGLLDSINHPRRKIFDLWRDCVCGSTMMMVCDERRDLSEKGIRIREAIGGILNDLMARGLNYEEAKTKILSLVYEKRMPLEEEAFLIPEIHKVQLMIQEKEPA
ncbi:MAG: hypothetical protein AAF492_09625 [Verrucomicrobiota bacterium]